MLIAHFSDSHLRPPGVLYQGLVDSNAMFESTIRFLNDLKPAPDLVLFGGDLVDEGSAEEYAVARAALSAILKPLLAIPGNHDDRERFRTAFRSTLISQCRDLCISRSEILVLSGSSASMSPSPVSITQTWTTRPAPGCNRRSQMNHRAQRS